MSPSSLQGLNPHVDVTDIATYPVARLAVTHGQFVRVIATGNAEGMSPVYQCIDSEGQTTWLSTQDVIVLDDAAPSFDLVQRITAELGKNEMASSTRR